MIWRIHHAAVACAGFTVEKMKKKETKTRTTPIKNILSRRVAVDFFSILSRKKIIKIKRIATFNTLMEKDEIKNHFIWNLISDMV